MELLSPSSEPRDSLPLFLFQVPKKWTQKHFRTLKLVQHPNLSANDLIGAQYLPSDEDEEFERLVTDFTEPTKYDLADLGTKRSTYRRNPFHLVFLRLNEAAKSSDYSETSKQALIILSEILISNIEAAKDLRITLGSRIPFKIRSCGVQGALKCEGVLDKIAVNNAVSPYLPLGIFSVVTGHDDSNIALEVSQILLQAILAYEHAPTVDHHSAFVLRMDRTILQLSMAIVPRSYMEELTQGKPLSENLAIFHSERYDLYESDRRKEALKVFIGLFRLLDAETRNR